MGRIEHPAFANEHRLAPRFPQGKSVSGKTPPPCGRRQARPRGEVSPSREYACRSKALRGEFPGDFRRPSAKNTLSAPPRPPPKDGEARTPAVRSRKASDERNGKTRSPQKSPRPRTPAGIRTACSADPPWRSGRSPPGSLPQINFPQKGGKENIEKQMRGIRGNPGLLRDTGKALQRLAVGKPGVRAVLPVFVLISCHNGGKTGGRMGQQPQKIRRKALLCLDGKEKRLAKAAQRLLPPLKTRKLHGYLLFWGKRGISEPRNASVIYKRELISACLYQLLQKADGLRQLCHERGDVGIKHIISRRIGVDAVIAEAAGACTGLQGVINLVV